MRQGDLKKQLGVSVNIPVLHFTQLIGLAFGIDGNEFGLERLIVDPSQVLRERGLL